MRATVVLAVVAGLLAAIIFLVERRVPSTDERRAGQARLLPRFDRARVRRVTIARAGAAPFSLERAAGAGDAGTGAGGGGDAGPAAGAAGVAGTATWRVLPGGKPADEGAVDELLAELDFAEASRDADLTRAQAGLAPPRVQLEVDDGQRHPLALGRPDAGGRGVFVDAGGDARVRVGPRRLLDLADREPGAFRDRRAVVSPPLGAGAPVLSWSGGGAGPGQGDGLSQAAGRWRNARAEWVSDERAAEAVRRLAGLRVARFVATPPPVGAAPAIERTLTVAGAGAGAAGRTALSFTAATCAGGDAQILVERADPSGSDWLCLSAEAVEDLWRALAAAHARDDRLIGAAPDAVTGFEIAAGARRVALDGANGRWRFTAPDVPYGADDDAVRAWLAALAGVRIDLAPAPSVPAGTTLTLKTARFEEHITVAPPPASPRGAPLPIQRAGEPAPARVPASVAALVDPDPLRFRDRRVLNLARFDAQRLRIAAAGRVAELLKSADQSWRASAPPGAAVDTAALDQLLATLTNLRVERYLPPDTRLTADLTLTLTERPPGASAPIDHVVELGPRRADGCQGRLRDGEAPAAFLVAPGACDELRAVVAR